MSDYGRLVYELLSLSHQQVKYWTETDAEYQDWDCYTIDGYTIGVERKPVELTDDEVLQLVDDIEDLLVDLKEMYYYGC